MAILNKNLFMREPHISALAHHLNKNIAVVDRKRFEVSEFVITSLYPHDFRTPTTLSAAQSLTLRNRDPSVVWLKRTPGHFAALVDREEVVDISSSDDADVRGEEDGSGEEAGFWGAQAPCASSESASLASSCSTRLRARSCSGRAHTAPVQLD